MLELKVLGYPKQMDFVEAPEAYVLMCGGKGSGKTRAGAMRTLLYCLKHPGVPMIVTAPTNDMLKLPGATIDTYREVFGDFASDWAVVNKVLTTKLDHEIYFRSTDDPAHLKGMSVAGGHMDEAALSTREAFQEIVARLRGFPDPGLWITTTPLGFTWVYREFVPQREGRRMIQVSTRDNTIERGGFLSSDYVRRLEEQYSGDLRLQEIEGQFIEMAGIVFRNVDKCVHGKLEAPIPGHQYVFGVDLGKHEDFTVIIGADQATRRVVFFDRFTGVDWIVQKGRIGETARRYNSAQMMVDSTGVGEPIFEDLKMAGVNVKGFQFTAGSKQNLINNLILKLDQEQIRFPEIDQLLTELKVFQYEPTKAHNLRTGAPSGFHDDCVIALALCVEGLGQFSYGVPVDLRRLNRVVMR